jgi:hypothetical protein
LEGPFGNIFAGAIRLHQIERGSGGTVRRRATGGCDIFRDALKINRAPQIILAGSRKQTREGGVVVAEIRGYEGTRAGRLILYRLRIAI